VSQPHHPKCNLNQPLKSVQTVQAKHRLQPLVLDHSNNELFVVDANFLIFLITHDWEELFGTIGLH